eukprot:159384_1
MGNSQKITYKISIVGLDSVGKATMLWNLKWDKIGYYDLAHMGFLVETIHFGKKIKKLEFECWVPSGVDKLRRVWPRFFEWANAIIFIVDSTNYDTLTEARNVLWNNVIKDKNTSKKPLLIFASKQDIDNAINVADIKEKLGLWKPIININDKNSLIYKMNISHNIIEIIKRYLTYYTQIEWDILQNRPWKIFPTSARTLHGVYDGLQWFMDLQSGQRHI